MFDFADFVFCFDFFLSLESFCPLTFFTCLLAEVECFELECFELECLDEEFFEEEEEVLEGLASSLLVSFPLEVCEVAELLASAPPELFFLRLRACSSRSPR